DVRGHVARMMSLRSYLGIAASRGKGEDRMIRIVEGVNDEVSGAGVVGVFLIDIQGNRSRQRLPPVAFVFGPHGSKQSERVEARCLEVVGILPIDLFHGVCV